MRISWISLKNWHCRKKWNVVLVSMLSEQRWFKVSSKLCRNLCSSKWLKPNLSLVSNFTSTWSRMLKILFSIGHECWRSSLGLVKFSRAFQNVEDKRLRLLGSSLFHSLITHGRKGFWICNKKKYVFACLAKVLMDRKS